MPPDYDDLKLCNCAECGRELLADDLANRALARRLRTEHKGEPLPPVVRGRITGRPYCAACLETAGHGNTELARPSRQASRGEGDGDNPWLEKATRDQAETTSEE